jgi:hypothetical protein
MKLPPITGVSGFPLYPHPAPHPAPHPLCPCMNVWVQTNRVGWGCQDRLRGGCRLPLLPSHPPPPTMPMYECMGTTNRVGWGVLRPFQGWGWVTPSTPHPQSSPHSSSPHPLCPCMNVWVQTTNLQYSLGWPKEHYFRQLHLIKR